MERKYAFDVLPSGNLFSELVDFSDTGYFDDQSLGESWQQTCHEMTTYFREEPPEFDDFHQEEPDEFGDSSEKEPPEHGDSPQKEPGKCGDLPLKPSECDDLPQEEAWAQPPSPPTSPPLTPSTTYTILNLTCMPLIDSNEPPGMSPEETVTTPQITGISPKLTYISPQMTAISPQMTEMSPQMTVMSPQITEMSPQRTNISPEKTGISPENTSISPEITSILPQITSISPQLIIILPQMTSISPIMTGMSPQEIPSLVPVPDAKKNVKLHKSPAIPIKGRYEYHCDFPTCNKVYTMRKFLNKHKRTHIKPFRCTAEGCKWRFARLSCYNRHMLSKHTVGKQFHCRFCNKFFTRSDNLIKHETVQCSVGLKLQRKNK